MIDLLGIERPDLGVFATAEFLTPGHLSPGHSGATVPDSHRVPRAVALDGATLSIWRISRALRTLRRRERIRAPQATADARRFRPIPRDRAGVESHRLALR
jgi:hypothetical protein